MGDRKLTPKRQRFVDAYTGEAMGNATEAARIAGYKSPRSEGCRLLTFADIQQEIAKVSQPRAQAAIATREERLAFYTEMMLDDEQQTKDRLKAAELLGKVQGDFIERQQVEHSGGAVTVRLTYDEARRLAAEGDD